MQRIYAIDVCDFWRGKLSLRRLRVLIEHLPTDSATLRALAGIDSQLASWSLSDLLLGRLIDETSLLRWQWESAHLSKTSQQRRQPQSVLPDVKTRVSTSADADVIPLVSPHKLGGFIDEDDTEGSDSGK